MVDAADNLKVISQWLEQCTSGLTKCSVWPKDSFQPTRLIHVFTSEAGVKSQRLVRSSDIAAPFPGYITLSYCWGKLGKDIPWTLTRERLPLFSENIPDEVLPQTIADAIHVAYASKIPYIWIDSLCIIQDDHSDWKNEASLMGNVYHNALFTVISGTESSTTGLFMPRHQLKVSAADISLRSTTTSPSAPQAFSPPTNDDYKVTIYPLTTAQFRATHDIPAAKRAWCFQEELLSPRRLYFAEEGLNWECLCSDHHEMGVRRPGDVPIQGTTTVSSKTKVLFSDDSSRAIGEWCGIVEKYSRRQLSYHTDIFAALAGVASVLKSRYRCRYLAGLWEDDILYQMLWQRTGGEIARPVDLGVPSWSWTSVKGAVAFSRGRSGIPTSDAEYIDCSVETDGDEFGTVVPGGMLRLRARLLDCEVGRDEAGREMEKWENALQEPPTEERALVLPDHEGDGSGDGRDNASYTLRSGHWEISQTITPPGCRLDMMARVKLREGSRQDYEFATVFFDGEEEAKVTEFVVAYIGETQRPADMSDRNGIALTATESHGLGGEIGVYRRIGFVAFWDTTIQGNWELLMEQEKREIMIV